MDNSPDEKPASFNGLRVWLRAVSEDPPRMRFYSHVAVVALGWLLMLSPLTDRLIDARTALSKAKKNERRATAQVHLVEQQDLYRPMLTGSDNLLDWQNFLLSKVDRAGVELFTIEPYKPDKRGPFTVMRFHISVKAYNYEPLADLMDRIEHGERLVRVEDMQISQSSSFMLMTFVVRGLVLVGLPEIPLQDPVGNSVALVEGASPLEGVSSADGGDLVEIDVPPGQLIESESGL